MLLVLLLLGLLGDLAQVQSQGVALLVEECWLVSSHLAVGRRCALGRWALRGRDLVAWRSTLLLLLLLELSWRVATSILAKIHLELLVLILASDGLDGLDGVRNIGEVDKGAALLAQGVDQLDLAVLGEILS